MCGPHRRFAPLPSHTLRRIPQAVGVVATDLECLATERCVSMFQYRKR